MYIYVLKTGFSELVDTISRQAYFRASNTYTDRGLMRSKMLVAMLAMLKREIALRKIAHYFRFTYRIALHITCATASDFTFEITVAVAFVVSALLCTKSLPP